MCKTLKKRTITQLYVHLKILLYNHGRTDGCCSINQQQQKCQNPITIRFAHISVYSITKYSKLRNISKVNKLKWNTDCSFCKKKFALFCYLFVRINENRAQKMLHSKEETKIKSGKQYYTAITTQRG